MQSELPRRQFGMVPLYLALLAAVITAVVVVVRWESAEPLDSPQSRAVAIDTTGCGFASAQEGTGVAIGGNLVLTAAHVVAQSDVVMVYVQGLSRPAEVVAWDSERDLAVLAVDGLARPAVELGSLQVGDGASLVGQDRADRPATVLDWVELSIEEVMGTDKHARLGYRLSVAAGRGDSGAGVYDDSGRLVGMLFATQADEMVAWATASSEIETFLDGPEMAFSCDPDLSRITRV